MPTQRIGLGVTAIDGTLYAVGGDDGGSSRLSTLEGYDPVTDTWTTRASMPTARIYLGVAALNGVLYAVGSHSLDDGYLSTLEAYHP